LSWRKSAKKRQAVFLTAGNGTDCLSVTFGSPTLGKRLRMAKKNALGLDPKNYELDEDGLPRELVGAWVREKHERLRRYVDISRAVRRKFIGRNKAGATYIDLFCGPGRVRVEGTGEVMAGSPLIVWEESVARKTQFSAVHISDANATLSDAASSRLKAIGAPVSANTGLAEQIVERVIPQLNPYALHFAFLDPYSLSALPFFVIQRLATLERMDILIHVSSQDLNRNLMRYARQANSPLDRFAPGWKEAVGDLARSEVLIRGKILEHWRTLLKGIGMETAEAAELVAGSKNQPLYWLAFVARHRTALEFWERIREIDAKSGSLFDTANRSAAKHAK
jgi:three-Cys-motif partner protein